MYVCAFPCACNECLHMPSFLEIQSLIIWNKASGCEFKFYFFIENYTHDFKSRAILKFPIQNWADYISMYRWREKAVEHGSVIVYQTAQGSPCYSIKQKCPLFWFKKGHLDIHKIILMLAECKQASQSFHWTWSIGMATSIPHDPSQLFGCTLPQKKVK